LNDKPIREGFVDEREPPVVPRRPRETPGARHPAREPPPITEPTEPEELAAEPAAAPEPTAEPAPEVWPIKVRLLHKPTRNNKNEPIHELTFREPTGGDINRYGNPVRISQEGDVIIDEKKMTLMISTLAGVLLPFIEALDPRDWNSCAYRLRGFFLPDPSAW
jgi:hypothetical protein